ncbi:MAG: RsmE family RNA methyltransferase [Rhodothermales bacterium]
MSAETTSFLVPEAAGSPDPVRFPDDEAYHASQVLRLSKGNVVRVVDGLGTAYRVRLDRVDGDEVWGSIVERRSEEGEPSYRLILAMGILKNRGRMETAIEKLVELGVSEIIPLRTQRTEKVGFRVDRARNIVTAAVKQSKRCRVPTVHEAVDFSTFMQSASGDVRLICHEAEPDSASIQNALPRRSGTSITIVIGPEGGFSSTEVHLARQSEFLPVSLGPRRLRAETAAIVAAAACLLSDSQ